MVLKKWMMKSESEERNLSSNYCAFLHWSHSNTSISLSHIDEYKLKLCGFSFFSIAKAWLSLIKHHTGLLRRDLVILHWQGQLLRTRKLEAQIHFLNFHFTLLETINVEIKFSNTLVTSSISQVFPWSPFIYYQLGLVLKSDGRFEKIYQFSFPNSFFFNDYIA